MNIFSSIGVPGGEGGVLPANPPLRLGLGGPPLSPAATRKDSNKKKSKRENLSKITFIIFKNSKSIDKKEPLKLFILNLQAKSK
jgi:hypothetical protein